MKYETKFYIGDEVFVVKYGLLRLIVQCKVCEKTGTVELKDKKFACPSCDGTGNAGKWINNYYILTFGKVEKIIIEDDKRIKISYVLDSTGSRWNQRDCFPSRKEAQEFCDKRNEDTSKDNSE